LPDLPRITATSNGIQRVSSLVTELERRFAATRNT
jgi:hypothetical protein